MGSAPPVITVLRAAQAWTAAGAAVNCHHAEQGRATVLCLLPLTYPTTSQAGAHAAATQATDRKITRACAVIAVPVISFSVSGQAGAVASYQ